MYLVKEYVKGETLLDKLSRDQILSEEKAAKYIRQILMALNHCHAKGICHRNISPENIKITENDEVKMIDFFSAKSGEEVMEQITG